MAHCPDDLLLHCTAGQGGWKMPTERRLQKKKKKEKQFIKTKSTYIIRHAHTLYIHVYNIPITSSATTWVDYMCPSRKTRCSIADAASSSVHYRRRFIYIGFLLSAVAISVCMCVCVRVYRWLERLSAVYQQQRMLWKLDRVRLYVIVYTAGYRRLSAAADCRCILLQ